MAEVDQGCLWLLLLDLPEHSATLQQSREAAAQGSLCLEPHCTPAACQSVICAADVAKQNNINIFHVSVDSCLRNRVPTLLQDTGRQFCLQHVPATSAKYPQTGGTCCGHILKKLRGALCLRLVLSHVLFGYAAQLLLQSKHSPAAVISFH